MQKQIVKYCLRQAAARPLHGLPTTGELPEAAVVIPSLAESDNLPDTLRSLAANPSDSLKNVLVAVVVNNRGATNSANPDELAEQAADNQRTLRWLERNAAMLPLNLCWIDASSPGQELGPREGVGMARKTGCDSVLKMLLDADAPASADFWRSFLFLHLDADTLVEPDYLPNVLTGLRRAGTAGASLAFRHQPAPTDEAQQAIDAYESYMDYYVEGLAWAGSPYAFHTVGSAMACTGEAYLKCGGMPARRLAGEDFYFLQKLAKFGGVCTIKSTAVHPSPRLSARVPFGTGLAMIEAVRHRKALAAYDPQTFHTLKELLQTVDQMIDADPGQILAALSHPEIGRFLESRGFEKTWASFARQHRTHVARLQAFHHWFDGLATLRLIHHLTDTRWPRLPLDKAWDALRRLRENR